MGAAIKFEIFAVIDPEIKRVNINFKPEIFATVIPAPKVFTHSEADTNRRVTKTEKKFTDTFREIGDKQIVQADLSRNIKSSSTAKVDTYRQIKISEKNSADTLRKIFQGKNKFDLLREVKEFEKFIADTSRKLNLEAAKVDTLRNVKNIAETKADTSRRTAITEKISTDILRNVAEKNIAVADTFRKVEFNLVTVVKADTLRIPGLFEKISADTFRNVSSTDKTNADTWRWEGSYNVVIADTVRKFREKISVDTLRKVIRADKVFADTVIRIPHILKYTINSPLVSTFKDFGVTSFSVNLQEKTLSDTFQISLAHPFEINEAIKGQFLDYPFSFLVEETSQQDLIQTVKGMYDQDVLLYTRLATNGITANNITEVMASEFITGIANYLGLIAIVKIDDFEPSNYSVDMNTTYASILSNIFGWTSKLPQRQINIFIRGDKLYCIQRGKEENIFDITDIPHTRPEISKKLMRTMWNCSDNKDERNEDDDSKTPFSGTISFGHLGTSVKLTYSNGLLIREEQNVSTTQIGNQATFTSRSITTYTYTRLYNDDEEAYYISTKKVQSYSWELDEEDTEKKTESESNIQYIYAKYWGEYYLSNEYETEESKSYETAEASTNWGISKKWEVTDEKTSHKETLHIPLGNGWYGQAVYVNGIAQGSNISQGATLNKVTQFTIEEMRKYQHTTVGYIEDDPESEAGKIQERLASLYDDSFPVHGVELKNQLTIDLEWLNRKIQEEISIDLVDTIVDGVPNILHVIDFTERIILDDNEYFLVSNQIQFNPRKLVQKLRLVRWY